MSADLAKIEGVDKDSIKVDSSELTADFKIKKGTEFKGKLDEFAKSNKYITDYEIVN